MRIKSMAKPGLLLMGATIAIVGALVVGGRAQKIDDKMANSEKRIAALNTVAARMNDYRERYVVAIETTPILIEASPERLLGFEGHTVKESTMQRVQQTIEDVCASLITDETVSPTEIEEQCSKRFTPMFERRGGTIWNLTTKSELLRYRLKIAKALLPYTSRRYFLARSEIEGRIEGENRAVADDKSEISRLMRWQSLLAVLGILVGLSKDLVHD